jgi:Protein of unknown function (DUF4232)
MRSTAAAAYAPRMVTPAVHALPARVELCSASQLGVRLGRISAAAGTTYMAIVFTNRGGAACSLRGYPGVSSVGGADGHQIGAPARRSPGAAPEVVLRPRAVASAVYGQVDALNYPKARCHPASARGLRVYPPGSTRAWYLPMKHLACSSSTVGDSSVRPVRSGATGGL